MARRGLALALLALAFGPALLLLRERPPVPQDTATETGPPMPEAAPEAAPPGTGPLPAADAAEAAPVVSPVAADAPPSPAPARKIAPPPPERWHGIAACPRDKRSTRDYNRCLYDNTRTSEQELEAELANAITVIEARSDLPGVQRTKWKALLDESQSRFLLFRNFDCQSVAPFEGPRGIGNFEQRALCLIEANTRRARELRARYGSPAAAEAVAQGAQGPWAPGGSWTHGTPPRLE
ncbi:lysozyme inhibitor LprI family protein [Xanthobacter autotrophicus DSM 431]|uniref:lysozyme inhibitor LprI family protein n=1 Tax=Xanthobacter nonsaccharivorans TaxID=3119912 RepID=UPI0037296BE2